MTSITKLPYGLAGTVYRSPMPFSPMFDASQTVLRDYLAARVDTVVMLTPEDEAVEITGLNLLDIYAAQGFEVILAPVEDFYVPEGDGFVAALRETLKIVREGRTVAVHCHAGIGRTGIFVACLARCVFGMEGEAAVKWIRQYIPDAVENTLQRQFVIEFDPLKI